MSDAIPSTFFGLPLAMKRDEAKQLTRALQALWTRQVQQQPASVEEDLSLLRRTFFDPLSTGTRLRQLLSELPPPPENRSRYLKTPLVVGEGNDLLVTPEGRLALEIIEQLLGEDQGDILVIPPDSMQAAEHKAYERYRLWSMRRIEDVIRLRAGKAQALPVPSVASLLLLLVNGSRSRETALRPLDDKEEQDRLDEAIGDVVSAFCDVLRAGTRDAKEFRLYGGGYAMTEARRRLPKALVREKDATYISPGHEDEVLSSIIAELRRQKRRPTTKEVMEAFDLLVATYRDKLTVFAAYEMAHEQRAETRRLRAKLDSKLGDDRRP